MIHTEEDQMDIGQWEMIPINAFLYFPSGEEVKLGSGEKAWRKIFENGQPYDKFQQQSLLKLQAKLKQMELDVHSWFNKANKLRFLQANKFKLSDTCKSIKEACTWRNNDFPVKVTDKITKMLNSGGFYFCGRDNQYRPILVSDISKFEKQDIDQIPVVLMVLIQFMLKEFLIPGQVQNYILILNLEAFSMSMKDTVMKIVSFTSNTYRGRLYASYLLSMPGLLKFGWDGIASKFVSENTLRKIKVSSNNLHEDMWKHIDKDTIEEKYGGNMKNKNSNYWPPSESQMIFESKAHGNKLISKQQYERKYQGKKLGGRKVEKRLLKLKRRVSTINNSIVRSQKNTKQEVRGIQRERNREKSQIIIQNIRQTSNLPKNLVKNQIEVPMRKRNFKLFFQADSYQEIKNK